MADIKTPFSDAVGPSSVPKTGAGKKSYDKSPAPDLPGRDGGYLKEVTYDNVAGDPKLKGGPITKSPFKDAVS